MRVWRLSSTPTLMCTIRAAVNRLDCVNSMCCDAQHEHVVVGDTGGHVRVWKLDPKLCSSTGAAAEACFTQVAVPSYSSPALCCRGFVHETQCRVWELVTKKSQENGWDRQAS